MRGAKSVMRSRCECTGARSLPGHTGQVLVSDVDGARAALRAGRPEDLLDVTECGWLDVKSGVYRLDDPASAEELAKDVAAFANTKTGGLLLIGFSTRKDPHQIELRGRTEHGVRPSGTRGVPA